MVSLSFLRTWLVALATDRLTRDLRLYEMMDRVREMRTGMKEQPEQVPQGDDASGMIFTAVPRDALGIVWGDVVKVLGKSMETSGGKFTSMTFTGR